MPKRHPDTDPARLERTPRRLARPQITFASAPWPVGFALAGASIMILLVGYLGAAPVVDTDLWYHLAYARQILSTGSLATDHTAFSWTPSDNAVIYCAWIAQLVLYGLHQLGGLPALFAFRYLMFAVALSIVLTQASARGVLRHPLTWLAVVLAVLMSSGAFFIKPQLASYVLMSAVVTLWFVARSASAQAIRALYALPVIMLVWANTHGGFVIGLGFVAIALVGELMNARLSPSAAVSATLRRHVVIAAALCAGAAFATPYGWRYPAQFFTVSLPAIDLQAVREYDTIFAPTQRGLHYVEYGGLMTGLLIALAIAGRRWRDFDWSLVLVNLAFAAFYVYYVRLTFFWAPVALASSITLLAAATERGRLRLSPALGVACLLGSTLVAAFAIESSRRTPIVGSWFGFGNGYWNPSEEAEFIAEHYPTARIGNDYNSGGYLIWRLWPRQRVFIDARYFPYRSWFQEYLSLETTDGIERLLHEQAADLWCVSLLLPRTVAWFRSSPDWSPAFLGASAVVFVRKGLPLPGSRFQVGARIDDIRNLFQALNVMAFAIDVGDLTAAERTVRGMERRFTSSRDRPVVDGARRAVDGLVAHARGDHAAAVQLLSGVAGAYAGTPAAAFVKSALLDMARLWQSGDTTAAFDRARLAVSVVPHSALARYNAGALAWWNERTTASDATSAWRADLTAFLAMAQPQDASLAPAIDAARAMLEGRATSKPTLLVPLTSGPPVIP